MRLKLLLVFLIPLIVLGAGVWLESALITAQPMSKVIRLMTLPPADIQLSSPLWDYRIAHSVEWTLTEKPSGLREFSWSGLLPTDPDVPGLQVLSGEKVLPALTPDEWEKSSQSGYLYIPGREQLIVKDYFYASDHTQFYVTNLKWANPILEWGSLMISSDAKPVSMCLAFDGIWASTTEISCDDWITSNLSTVNVPEGTHTLYIRSTGTFSTQDKSQQKQIFVRNVKVKEPVSLRVRLPLEAAAPVIRYRPLDPEKTLLSQPESSPQPLQSSPWNQYDESSLFVRPMEIDNCVRTGVFLPTPSEWRVSLSLDQLSDLVFYPTVCDPSNHEAWGAADLEVMLESGSGTKTLWRGEVNPLKEEDLSSWKRGVYTTLGAPVGERITLIFRSRNLPGAGGKSQPLLLGEPLLVPSATLPRAPSPNDPKSVILISVDTFRADAAGCIGGGKATPWMDQYFGSEGVVWSRAEAPCSWTLPSHASLMLSQFISRHGVVMHFNSIPPNAVTLAEYFASHQYETVAFVDREYLNYRFGFHQGFRLFEQIGGNFKYILPRCLEYLRSRNRNVPLFLFLHTYDTHDPYIPPQEYRQRFVREGLKPSNPNLDNPDLQWDILMKSSLGKITLSPGDPEYVRSLYLAETAYVDDMLRNFFTQINSEQLLQDPLVILVSDHGEAFFEHKSWQHGNNLYEEVIHVPVLFHLPEKQYAGHRLEENTSLLDVPPTLFEILGWTAPDDWQGISVLSSMADPTLPLPNRPLYSELIYNGDRTFFTLTQGNHKFINTIRKERVGEKLGWSRTVEAFDLKKDPGEITNLAASELPQATQELNQSKKVLDQMQELLQVDGKIHASDLDPDTIRSLQKIGYLQPESNTPKKEPQKPAAPPVSSR